MLTFADVFTRGLAVGLIVGALCAGYLIVVTEPSIDEFAAMEDTLTASAPHDPAAPTNADGDHDEETFTRTQQHGGGALAMLAYTTVVAAVFAAVYAAFRHRIPARSELTRAAELAAAGFGTLALMPALKYPANPPGISAPDTISQRTAQYLACLLISVLLALALGRLSGLLRSRLDDPSRNLVMAMSTGVAYAAALLALPDTPDTIPPAVPAQLLWDFRIRSLGGLALMWAGLGLGLGWTLTRHVATTSQQPRPAAP